MQKGDKVKDTILGSIGTIKTIINDIAYVEVPYHGMIILQKFPVEWLEVING